jgi:transposase
MLTRVTLFPNLTIGVDLGDRVSRICGVDVSGEVVREGSVATTVAAMEEYFGQLPACRVVMEVGTHSPWIASLLERLRHEVIVANTALVYGRGRRKKRNDPMDAEFLARQGRADPKLLHPIRHRGAEAQEHLALIRARDQLVAVRTKLINHVRGAVKPVGGRITGCSANVFARKAVDQVPPALRTALEPVLEMISALTAQIRGYDREIERVAREVYPETRHLQQVAGVGAVTSLAYVLLIDDPERFNRSRDVGAYFGLVPKLDESSDSSPQLRITKAGDEVGRKLLVNAAHYILGPFGPDCDLRRHGERIAARGGKNAKKRAVIAVARKLSVLLHHLWITGAKYEPHYSTRRRAA